METESKELVLENHLSNETNIQNEVNNEETSSVTNISNSSDTSENVTQLTDSTSDLSKNPNDIDNVATFKKPTVKLIGPKRTLSLQKNSKISPLTDTRSRNHAHHSDRDIKSQHSRELKLYVEPSWGGKPEENYKIEILKSGMIIDTISLEEHSYYSIGRLPTCHLTLVHPTISRYHAILQYRCQPDNENDKGFYVYDLGSTHGTFWNGNRIKPNVYVRIQGGHILRFGCSQRRYILQAPPGDEEEESPYSLTELKEMRASQLEKEHSEDKPVEKPIEEPIEEPVEEPIEEPVEKPIEENESEGIDWGMGEDADEETDLQENPYASITDDDLVLDDPKKTLRGWFEREGYDLHYQAEEKGFGQFLCWVDLPTEDVVGHSIRAEALVRGKKKEAVVQCALEACKILDKYGLLRQANHEARKRKTRNWEAEDYYDSDEDNFLDRTGSVERKREQRMRLAGKLEEKTETYDSLLKKHKEVTERISHLSTSIQNWQNANDAKNDATEEDALDAFMSSLSSSALTKSDIAKMKLELQNLRKEEAGLVKLLNLTQPVNLPALSYSGTTDQTITQGKTAVDHTQNTSVETKKIPRPRQKKEKQINQHAVTNTELFESNAISNTTVETEAIEEMDSDDNDELISNTFNDEKNVESQRSDSATVAAENRESSEKHEEQQEPKIQMTKKRRREEKEMYCDQDIHADNYSTWVPPSDQAGDGKTSLNEKYGY
ncbi:kanadaptin isoform X1 [Frieseomelitta varia]|uniref:kanadaptin isoform X1 n=1 Tax=Frieseomelitta varia TaxID=561572 RepID=UPI001CB67DC6|nr:kanadaptin isoform X1 [Frieseomelitta varia]